MAAMATDDPFKERRAALRRQCTRFLHGHHPRTPAETLAAVADYCRRHEVAADRYGESEFVARFESEIAASLGKPAAVFLPTGVMAQLIALRIWTERASNQQVAFHPTSHLELHEERAYSRLHGFSATLLGPRNRVLLGADVLNHPEPLAALLVELPAREIGGLLPTWTELAELKRVVRERGIKLHMDGARLWESAAYYERPLPEICVGFDSVYVSFYKGLDGISGCALAGPADFIAEARIWQRRHGGSMFSVYPYAAAARMYMEQHIHRFPEYRKRALGIAQALSGVDGVEVAPAVPHVNMMHLFFRGTVEAIAAARDEIASKRRLWLSTGFIPADVPGWCRAEVYIGSQAMELEDAEVVEAFRELMRLAER